MASDVDICNLALANLGHIKANITSIDPPDSSVEAGLCARFYPIARAAAIEAAAWTFARGRSSLVETTNTSTTWTYAYVLPSDNLRALRVLPSVSANIFIASCDPDQVYSLVPNEGDSAPFEIEGTTLYTNEPDAVLFYLRDVTDTTLFSPTFVVGLSQLLSWFIAGPIIKGEKGAKVAGDMQQLGYATLSRASVYDARASSPAGEYVPAHIRARR